MSNCNSTNKIVFVIVGTTSFDELIDSALQEETLEALESCGFTSLVLQIGKGREPEMPRSRRLQISWYTLKESIQSDLASASLVISHGGAGSCLEALNVGVPLVVVVNERLMGNHQMELAKKLSCEGYAFTCQPQTLVDTIRTMSLLQLKKFPTRNPTLFPDYLENLMGFE